MSELTSGGNASELRITRVGQVPETKGGTEVTGERSCLQERSGVLSWRCFNASSTEDEDSRSDRKEPHFSC